MARSRVIDRGTLSRGLRDDVQFFEREAQRAAREAAMRATSVSRERFLSRLSGRSTVAPRPGRPTTQGTFADHIEWTPVADGHRVSAQVGRLQRVAPYWLIQEIGTGKSAKIASGGLGHLRGGQGRSGPRESGNVRVRSQAGRRIPSGLVWSGNSVGQDQIVPGPAERPITIRREIRGKHYLRTGGRAGFRRYEASMLNAAEKAFGRRRR